MSRFLLDLVVTFLSCLRNGVELKEIIRVVNKVLESLGVPDNELLTQREEVILAEDNLIKMFNAVVDIGAEGLRLADELKRVKEELEHTKSELKEKKKIVEFRGSHAQADIKAYGNTEVTVLGACTTTNITMYPGANLMLQLDGGNLTVNINDVFYEKKWWKDGKLNSSRK